MSAFEKKSVRIGVTFLSCGIIANFIPALYVYFAHGIIPPLSDLLKIWSVALAGFGITYVVQPTAFYTMMGVAISAGSVVTVLISGFRQLLWLKRLPVMKPLLLRAMLWLQSELLFLLLFLFL